MSKAGFRRYLDESRYSPPLTLLAVESGTAGRSVGIQFANRFSLSLSFSMLCQVLPHGPPGVSASLLPVRPVPGLPGQAPCHQSGH